MSTNFEDLIMRDTRANQPAAGQPGRLYYVTDEGVLERDNGSTWDDVSAVSSGGGALVFLEEQSASASSTLDFTNLSDDYDQYLLLIDNLVPSGAANNLNLRFASDDTPTWDAGGSNYRWSRIFWNYTTSGQTGDGGAKAQIEIGPVIGTTSGHSYSAEIHLRGLRTAGKVKHLRASSMNIIDVDSNTYACEIEGIWLDTTNKAYGIRLLMSSGTITSGVARLYGYAKS